MTFHSPLTRELSDRTHVPLGPDPITLLFDTTMTAGTTLFAGMLNEARLNPSQPTDYMLVNADIILEYERTIAELRRELLHYRRLVSELRGLSAFGDDYDAARPVTPLGQSSTRLVDSIVRAHIPNSASFKEFDEGEW
jgi:hypothetical protein